MHKEKVSAPPLRKLRCNQRSRHFFGLALAAALVAAPKVSHAEPDIRELSIRPAIDLPLTAGGGVVWIGSELLKAKLAPEKCRWCEHTPAVDRAARDHLRWENPHAAGVASDVLDFGILPVLVLGGDALLASRHGALRGWDEDATVIAEAAIAAAVLNQVIKFSVGRERPFVHALESDEEKAGTGHASDNNLSFYSGHTSLAFALVGSAGAVAQMRGYEHAWLVWPVGGVLAASIGYLRIGADKHWLTDVATGAVVGGAIGVGMPYLLHAPEDADEGESSNPVQAGFRGPVFQVAFVF
jgi:membrane-associated phospholipid phosphatase